MLFNSDTLTVQSVLIVRYILLIERPLTCTVIYEPVSHTAKDSVRPGKRSRGAPGSLYCVPVLYSCCCFVLLSSLNQWWFGQVDFIACIFETKIQVFVSHVVLIVEVTEHVFPYHMLVVCWPQDYIRG